MQEIIKTLMKELSLDPYVQENRGFNALCERSLFWETKANEMGDDIAAAIRDSARKILATPPATALQFDMTLLDMATQALGLSTVEKRSKFSEIADEVIRYHKKPMDFLASLPGAKTNPIIQRAEILSDNLAKTARGIGAWGNHVLEGLDIAASLPLPADIKGFLTNVKGVVSDAQEFTAHLAPVIDGLWGKTDEAVKSADLLQAQLGELGNELRQTADPGTQATIKAKMSDIASGIEGLVNKESVKIANVLNDVRGGFQAVAQITGLLGNPKLASDILAVGETAVSVAGSIATLITGSAVGGPAMPLIAITGAVGMLVSRLFGKQNDPPPEQVILDQLSRLSAHIDERFDRVEVMIGKAVDYLAEHIDKRVTALATHLDDRLDRLTEMLKYMTKEMLDQFRVLHQHLDTMQANSTATYAALKFALDGIAHRVDHVHRDLIVIGNLLYAQPYLITREAALSKVAPSAVEANTHRRYYREIVQWATEGSQNAISAGNPNPTDVIDRVNLLGPFLNIQALKNRAVALTANATMVNRILDPGPLANPAIWAEGTRTLIHYVGSTPDLYKFIRDDENLSTIPADIERLEERGETIQAFIRQLQCNQPLFETLIQKYETALIAVIRQVYSLSVNTTGVMPEGIASTGPKDAIQRAIAMSTMDTFLQRELPLPTTLPAAPQPPITPEVVGQTGAPRKLEHPEILRGAGSFVCRLQRHGDDREGSILHVMNGHLVAGLIRMRDHGAPDFNLRGAYDATIAPLLERADELWAGYTATRQEADQLRGVVTHMQGAATQLLTYVNDFIAWCGGQYRRLQNDPAYRMDRIASILSHAAVRDVHASAAAGTLPDRDLIERYFKSRNPSSLNPLLGTLAAGQATVDPSLQPLLTTLQKEFDELIIFIGFAFPRQFTTDTTLQAFINTLWNQDRFCTYLAKNFNTPDRDFIGVALQKSLESKGELDYFKKYITQCVTSAKYVQDHHLNSQEYDYPLITQVLAELKSFKCATKLATTPVIEGPQRAPIIAIPSLGTFIQSNNNRLHEALNRAGLTISDPVKEEVLARIAVEQEVEIIILDQQSSEYGELRAINPGAKQTIHLLRISEHEWHPFTPSDSCTRRADYRAARLMAVTDEMDNTMLEQEEALLKNKGADTKILGSMQQAAPAGPAAFYQAAPSQEQNLTLVKNQEQQHTPAAQ